MRAFDFASRVARLFATRGAVLQNANIRKFAPKSRRRRGEELAFDVVNEDVFLRNARFVHQLANDGQDHLRGRVAKVVLFARSAVVQVDFDRDDFALLAPAFEFSGRLVEMTEDFAQSVDVDVGPVGDCRATETISSHLSRSAYSSNRRWAFFPPLAGPARGFRITRRPDATGEDSLRFADRFVRRARLPIETDRRAITFGSCITERGRFFRALGFGSSSESRSERERRRRRGFCQNFRLSVRLPSIKQPPATENYRRGEVGLKKQFRQKTR